MVNSSVYAVCYFVCLGLYKCTFASAALSRGSVGKVKSAGMIVHLISVSRSTRISSPTSLQISAVSTLGVLEHVKFDGKPSFAYYG